MSVDPQLRASVEAWIARDPDSETRAELEALLVTGDEVALRERFSGRLEFGTAGLRAPMQAGPMGMNRVVVRESAAGIARYLLANEPESARRGVVIAHDARHRSDRFARDCAEVIAAHGIRVALAEPPQPTPVGVFAVRPLHAAAGIVITASHNPPADNGLKLFMGDAALPPASTFVQTLLFTPRGLGLLIVGSMVGGVLAATVFAISVVAVPLLLLSRGVPLASK